MRLTDEYKRITEQFKDLQSKFRHFEQVDTKKYAEVRHHWVTCGAVGSFGKPKHKQIVQLMFQQRPLCGTGR